MHSHLAHGKGLEVRVKLISFRYNARYLSLNNGKKDLAGGGKIKFHINSNINYLVLLFTFDYLVLIFRT